MVVIRETQRVGMPRSPVQCPADAAKVPLTARETEQGLVSMLRHELNVLPRSFQAWRGRLQPIDGHLESLVVGRDRATENYRVALRLSPRDSRIFLAQVGMAMTCLLRGDHEEGLDWAKATIVGLR